MQHERGPRKAKPKILSVSSMILPASSGPSAPPVACSSSPTMAHVSSTSMSHQFNRKAKHSPPQQHPMSCLPTMDNYTSFSTIINQVIDLHALHMHSTHLVLSIALDNIVRSSRSSSLHHDQLATNGPFLQNTSARRSGTTPRSPSLLGSRSLFSVRFSKIIGSTSSSSI